MRLYFTYIVTNKKRGTLYTGMTNDVINRVKYHRTKNRNSFTGKYNIKKLVWFQSFSTPDEAILREKEIKGWLRGKKVELIEKSNPDWKDLYSELRIEMDRKYQSISNFWPCQK